MNISPSKTIVLIHGQWVTQSSWEKFKGYFESRGHKVIASPWPGINKDVVAMRRDPSSLNGIGIEDLVAHYTTIIRGLSEPPILAASLPNCSLIKASVRRVWQSIPCHPREFSFCHCPLTSP